MTNPDNVGGLPLLQFAVFDEFGKGADDRVWDYGRRCFEAGKLCRAAPAGGDVDAQRRLHADIIEWEQRVDAGELSASELWTQVRPSLNTLRRLIRDSAPAGGDDLYRQACDSVEEWKARALEAEADIARIHAQINAENGPTFMGEPVVSAPAGSGEVEVFEDFAREFGADLTPYPDKWKQGDVNPPYKFQHANDLWNAWQKAHAAALLRKLQQGAE